MVFYPLVIRLFIYVVFDYEFMYYFIILDVRLFTVIILHDPVIYLGYKGVNL